MALDWNPLSVQLPEPLQVSWFLHCEPATPHVVPDGFGVVDEHTPVETLQVAAKLHGSPAVQLTGFEPTHTLF